MKLKEVRASFKILAEALNQLRSFKDIYEIKFAGNVSFKKNSLAIGITEGWRGEIVYLVITDSDGNVSRVDVRDPSFMNWPVVSYAARGNVVPDFPLINKSFNLSYSGNDL